MPPAAMTAVPPALAAPGALAPPAAMVGRRASALVGAAMMGRLAATPLAPAPVMRGVAMLSLATPMMTGRGMLTASPPLATRPGSPLAAVLAAAARRLAPLAAATVLAARRRALAALATRPRMTPSRVPLALSTLPILPIRPRRWGDQDRRRDRHAGRDRNPPTSKHGPSPLACGRRPRSHLKCSSILYRRQCACHIPRDLSFRRAKTP